MINTAFFVVFTCLSANLAVQFALGVRDSIGVQQGKMRFSLYQSLILFFSIIIIWLIFVYILLPLSLAFLETLLLIPLSIGIAFLIEKGLGLLLSKRIQLVHSSVFSAYHGLVFGAAFFTLKTAVSFSDVLIMAGGFTAGYVISMAIVLEIYKRSAIEAVPSFLRGTPLFLISLGLMSLICSAAAAFFLQMINI